MTFTHEHATARAVMHIKRDRVAKKELQVTTTLAIHADQPGYDRQQTTALLDAVHEYWLAHRAEYNYGWSLAGEPE